MTCRRAPKGRFTLAVSVSGPRSRSVWRVDDNLKKLVTATVRVARPPSESRPELTACVPKHLITCYRCWPDSATWSWSKPNRYRKGEIKTRAVLYCHPFPTFGQDNNTPVAYFSVARRGIFLFFSRSEIVGLNVAWRIGLNVSNKRTRGVIVPKVVRSSPRRRYCHTRS